MAEGIFTRPEFEWGNKTRERQRDPWPEKVLWRRKTRGRSWCLKEKQFRKTLAERVIQLEDRDTHMFLSFSLTHSLCLSLSLWSLSLSLALCDFTLSYKLEDNCNQSLWYTMRLYFWFLLLLPMIFHKISRYFYPVISPFHASPHAPCSVSFYSKLRCFLPPLPRLPIHSANSLRFPLACNSTFSYKISSKTKGPKKE